MVQTRSLLRPLFSPLPVLTRRRGFSSRPNVTHHFAARGVFTLVRTRVTGGRGTSGGHLEHRYTSLHQNVPFGITFLGIHLQCVNKGEVVNCSHTSWEQSGTLYYTGYPKGEGTGKRKEKKKTLKSHINYAANMSSKW